MNTNNIHTLFKCILSLVFEKNNPAINTYVISAKSANSIVLKNIKK